MKYNKILDKIYADISNPESLGSLKDLFDRASVTHPNISKKDVYNYLLTKDSYTLFKRNPQNFKRRCHYFKKPGYVLVLDTMFIKPFDPSSRFPYLAVIIDGFSKFAHTEFLSSLKMNYVSKILDNFLNNSIFSYSKIYSDSGSEYSGKLLLKMYKKHDITWYTTHSKNKTSIAERFIRTLKIKISKYIVECNKLDIIDAIPRLVHAYNIRKHRTLEGYCPLEVHLMTKWSKIRHFSSAINKSCTKHIKSVKRELAAGSVVRLRLDSSNIFSNRAHNIVNTAELFIVQEVQKTTPVTYKISTLDKGEIVSGAFYHNELVPAIDSGLYRINIIKQKYIRKKLMYLVQYINYPNHPNQWMSADQLKKLK